jgi:hypothetical protein
MVLFIQIENGAPKDHPILLENLMHAVPGFDPHNLPSWLMPFEKIQQPTVHSYQTVEHGGYEIVDGKAHDVWIIKDQPEVDLHNES